MARPLPQRILLVRNDKLGDFMLAWPTLAAVKLSLPNAYVAALVPTYTEPMARLCPWIDEIIIDPGPAAGQGVLHQRLSAFDADVLLTLFSTTRVGLAGWTAGIRYRLAPASKLAQLFYNHRLRQQRSRSEKPEWEYNLDLARHCLAEHGVAPVLATAPYLSFPATETAHRRQAFCQEHHIAPQTRLVLLHPGSGGSASTLSVEQYAALAAALRSTQPLHFVIGCGPGEDFKAETLAALLDPLPHTILRGNGIADYARFIAGTDLFIGGSTGPLHVAGALDVPTAGFYPRRRSATPLRWQTLNSPQRRLAFTPPETAAESDMASIDTASAADLISRQFLGG
jgi:ADP-heptose:LPS heptosyltransferase